MIYRRQASPLHAARAAAGLTWCAGLLAAGLLSSSPWPLLALTLAIIVAGALAHCWSAVKRALMFALPMALMICLINALVSRTGLTVIWRFGNLPLIGETNVTLEATLFGAFLGLKAVTLMLVGALYSTAIDPDEVLRLLRRFSFASALTATIATRMVPILLRDSQRLADAQRCRPGLPPSRVALLRATTAGVLDRALDVAAALEVRGYGAAHQTPSRTSSSGSGSGSRRRWSRHDYAFTAAGVSLIVVSTVARFSAADRFHSSVRVFAPFTVASVIVSAALVALVLAPFVDQRGVAR